MTHDAAGPAEWAGRFEQQAAACETLGSELWARLLRIVAVDVDAEGPSWSVVRQRAALRFGQAGPLRLVGAAHRLALAGDAPEWAELLPSCGGSAPVDGEVGDRSLRAAWRSLVAEHGDALVLGLDREVQTNEVGRAAALGYAHAVASAGPRSVRRRDQISTTTSGSAWRGTGGMAARLVELGCSGGLNLRLDRFRVELTHDADGGLVLGDPGGGVRLAPEVRAPIEPGVSTGSPVRLVERIGIDPHPIDPTTDDGRLTLLSFVWPDQVERFDRLAAAIDVAREVPASLVATGRRRTAEVLAEVLARPADPVEPGDGAGSGVATIVQHSIVWQYIPTDQRPEVTAAIEEAGERASVDAPLVWVRFEPDEWDRTRAAVWARRWPDGGDRLVAHADFHGRWLAPVPAP